MSTDDPDIDRGRPDGDRRTFVLAHHARPLATLGTRRAERLQAATGAVTVTLDRNDGDGLIEVSDGAPIPWTSAR